MASQVTATPQMFMAPPTASGGNSTTTMIIVLIVFVIFISMSVAAYFLFFKKEEGKECKIKDGDKNGVYKYDEDLDCVLDGCKKGYEVSGTKCITERKPGDSCFVTSGDSKGTYKLDAFKKCVLKSCTTGYKVENGKCVSITPSTTPAALMTIKDSAAPRLYPPKPYPRTTPDNQVKNIFSWRVDGADYGNGMYKVVMNGSMAADASWHGVLDAEGL